MEAPSLRVAICQGCAPLDVWTRQPQQVPVAQLCMQMKPGSVHHRYKAPPARPASCKGPGRARHAHDQVPHAAAHLLHSAPRRVAGAGQVCGAARGSECNCGVSCCAGDLAPNAWLADTSGVRFRSYQCRRWSAWQHVCFRSELCPWGVCRLTRQRAPLVEAAGHVQACQSLLPGTQLGHGAEWWGHQASPARWLTAAPLEALSFLDGTQPYWEPY